MTLQAASFKLAQAHAALAAAFAHYPLRGGVAGCPCCVSAADHAELLRGDLRRYAFKAMTTWGDELNFKHFLPVLVAELTPGTSYYPTDIHGGACDLQCLAGKLAYTSWQRWPAAEQQAVLSCLRGWWQLCLPLLEQDFAAFLAGSLPEGWGNSAGPAYEELLASNLLPAAWLRQAWREAALPQPQQPLAEYVQSATFLTLADYLYSQQRAHGALPPEAPHDPGLRPLLEAGFFVYADRLPLLAQRLSDLLYCLEHPGRPPAAA